MNARQVWPLLTTVLMLPTLHEARAQVGVQVVVNGGTATDQRGVRSAATTVAPVFTLRDTPGSGIVLFGSATRFAREAHSISAGGALRLRTTSDAPIGASLSVDGSFTTTSFDARFTNAQLSPSLEWRLGSLLVSGGVRAAHGSTSFSLGASETPRSGLGSVFPQPTQPTRTSTSRSLWGPQSQLTLLLPNTGTRPAARVALEYGAWRTLAPHDADARMGSLHDVSFGATVALGHVVIQGAAGRRFQRAANATSAWSASEFGSAQLEIAVTRTLAVTMGGGSYLGDPITGALAGRFLTAGASMRFGGVRTSDTQRSRLNDAPRVRGIGSPAPGMTRLAIRARNAVTVAVAGDWNTWQPHAATKASDGFWYVDLALDPGEYRYAFLVDGSTWRVPDHAVTSDDGLGGKVAWLSVPTADRTTQR